MTGTIVCAVDDSDGVSVAVEVARELAERFDARLLLVSVADGFGLGVAVSGHQARADARRRLDRVVEEHELPDEEHRVAVGDPVEAVALIAAEEAADVIVVGARRGLLGRTLRSSLADELAATAPCPVVGAPAALAARLSHAGPRA